MKDIDRWYEIKHVDDVISPSLLVYPDRVRKNVEIMIAMAGGTERLRPHIKTHKIAEIITLQMDHGINKFKCATIAEAELLARCGAKDILLAMQPVGSNVTRYLNLMTKYPDSLFSTLVDNMDSISEMSIQASAKKRAVRVWLDINNGMNRTGIIPGEEAKALYRTIVSNSSLTALGLHVYDGHIHETDLAIRRVTCNQNFEPVVRLKGELEAEGIEVQTIVAGGTPTFPIHLEREKVETSPGTPLLWDQGYTDLFPEMKFLPAAVLLTRIVSKPAPNLICFDLGHKSVASEMQLPRVKFLGQNKSEQVSQSEEHLVVKAAENEQYNIGEVHYALPIHICPTVIKYKNVLTVTDGEVTGSWEVAARDHKCLTEN